MKGFRQTDRAMAWLTAATMVLNLAMVGYHRVMSEGLGLAYGDLAVVVGILGLLVAVVNGVTTWATRMLALDAGRSGPRDVVARLVSWTPRLLGVLGLATAAVYAAGRWIGDWLRLSDPALYDLAVLAFLAMLVGAILRGATQALRRYDVLGWSLLAEGAGRLGLGALLLGAGGDATAGLWAWILGAVAGAVACVPALWSGPTAAASAPLPARDGDRRGLVLDTACLALFGLLGYLDLFVVKNTQSAETAALYARAGIVARCFLLVPVAFTPLVLGETAAARVAGLDPRPILRRALAVNAVLVLGGLAVVAIIPGFAVLLFCGPGPFEPAVALVPWLSAAMVPLGFLMLPLYQMLVTRRRAALAIAAGAALSYGASLAVFHETVGEVVGCLAVVGSLGAVVATVVAFRQATSAPPATMQASN
jgi:hypothetical protein